MKKSLVLGFAAVAAAALAPLAADASEFNLGGYYRFQAVNNDTQDSQDDNTSFYAHRLNLEFDWRTSPKTHVHMRYRPITDQAVEGNNNVAGLSGTGNQGLVNANGNENAINRIDRLWLETEAWGIGVKAGQMPVSLNDDLLVNSANKPGTSSTGAVVLSKTFGATTVVLADVKAQENDPASCADETPVNGVDPNVGGALGEACTEDDIDVYAASVLGKAANINYQATLAGLDAGSDSWGAGNTHFGDNWWFALTGNTAISGIDLTGTVIYEDGSDEDDNGAGYFEGNGEDDGEGWMVGLRAKGKASFGGWNAYGFYGDEDYDAIPSRGNPLGQWSYAYANDGYFHMVNDTIGGAANDSASGNAEAGENLWGVGAGITVEAAGWTINPQLDYAAVVDDVNNNDADDADVWGGSLILSTKIDEGTKFSLYGGLYDSSDADVDGSDDDGNHHLMAEIQVDF